MTDAPTKREREGALGLLQGLAFVTDTFFVDGIHDDILTRITRIGAMKGIAPTSVERFRDTNLATSSLRQAGFRPMSEISAKGGTCSKVIGHIERT